MNDELENDLRQLNTWAKLSFAGGGVYIFAAALIILMTLPVTLGLMDLDSSLAELIDTLYVCELLAFVISAIVIGTWIYRAHDILFIAGLEGLEYSPPSSIYWFMVPIASLFKPYQAMRELWERTCGAPDASGVVPQDHLGLWWGTFLVSGLIDNIAGRLLASPDNIQAGLTLGLVGTSLRLVSAVLMLKIVWSVTIAEQRFVTVGSTFD